MNARITLSATGEVALPADLRERLAWPPGTMLEVVEADGRVVLQPVAAAVAGIAGYKPPLGKLYPRKTLADLDALPRPYHGPAKSIEEISSVSDEMVRRMIHEGD